MANGKMKVTAQFVANGVRREIDLDRGIVGAVVVDLEDFRRAQQGQQIATGVVPTPEIFDLDTFQTDPVEQHGVLDVRTLGEATESADEPVWWHVKAICTWFHTTEPPPE